MAAPQKRFQRRKFCRFCSEKVEFIDYKDVKFLRNYITGKRKNPHEKDDRHLRVIEQMDISGS